MVTSTFEDKNVSKNEKKSKSGKNHVSRLICLGIY
jgi:hypothetical protein